VISLEFYPSEGATSETVEWALNATTPDLTNLRFSGPSRGPDSTRSVIGRIVPLLSPSVGLRGCFLTVVSRRKSEIKRPSHGFLGRLDGLPRSAPSSRLGAEVIFTSANWRRTQLASVCPTSVSLKNPKQNEVDVTYADWQTALSWVRTVSPALAEHANSVHEGFRSRRDHGE
jgi:hypothetical protein